MILLQNYVPYLDTRYIDSKVANGDFKISTCHPYCDIFSWWWLLCAIYRGELLKQAMTNSKRKNVKILTTFLGN